MNVVLRLTSRCNLTVCFWLMVSGGCIPSVRTQWSVLVFAPPPLVQSCQSLVVWFVHSIDDRLCGLVDTVFALWLRWPLVLSTSSSTCLELCEVSMLSSTDVRTPILTEWSLCNFVCCSVRRDLDHNLSDWGFGSLLVYFMSLVDKCQVTETH